MNLKNVFKSKSPAITPDLPGTVMPINDINTQDVIETPVSNTIESPKDFYPPCPATLMLVCVCSQCKYVQNCPMEKVCRMEDCNVFIRACGVYTNDKDIQKEDKRVIFKSGGQWEGHTFFFKGKNS